MKKKLLAGLSWLLDWSMSVRWGRFFRLVGTIAVVLVAATIVYGGYTQGWEWVGIGEEIKPSAEPKQAPEITPYKTLWDWLDLFIIPLALALLGYFYNRSEKKTDRQLAVHRAESEAMQAYLSAMTDLITDKSLSEDERDSPVRTIARSRTLTVLRQLNEERKSDVVRFLYEAKLIDEDEVVALNLADLSGASLGGAVLEGANLRGAVLEGANLRGANLSRANLSETDLSNADLSSANLIGADLSGARLRDADLTRADLFQADLSRAVVVLANLTETKLRNAHMAHTDLSRAYLDNADLHGAFLRQADLNSAYLHGVDLERANLINANLSRAFLHKANLFRSNLYGANLSNADLSQAVLVDVDLRRACLSGISERNLTRYQIASAVIDDNTKLPDWLKPESPEPTKDTTSRSGNEDAPT